MYNQSIETFIRVADAGSFNKAAEEMYITPPAVIKQINSMESKLGLELFTRTHRGLVLTDAGESFYEDMKCMIKSFNESVDRAKAAMQKGNSILRIGTSPMTPGEFLVDLWPRIHTYSPSMKFKLVPFENKPEISLEGMKNFGKTIDLVVGVIDEAFLKSRECDARKLSDEPVRLAVPFRHRLASKEILTVQDLYGESLMLIRRNWSRHIDILRGDIEQKYSQIQIIDFDFYGMDAFNQCENNHALIMTIDRWKDAHPLFKVLPVQWNYTIPFGILHSDTPSDIVCRFLDAVQYALSG